MSISLNDDFRDIIEAFQEEDVDFLVVGAYAMAGHGYVRATGDIDLFIRRDARNAGKVLRALSRFGAPLATVSESDFLLQGRVFRVGVYPRCIDVLNEIDGLSFDEASASGQLFSLAGLDVRIPSLDALIKNKRSTGRNKDARDADELAKRQTP